MLSLRDGSSVIGDGIPPYDLQPSQTSGTITPSAPGYLPNGVNAMTASFYDVACDASVAVFSLVRTIADKTVTLASANTAGQVVGIVVSKSSPTFCRVKRYGYVEGLTGLIPQSTYLLGLNGTFYPAPVDPTLTYVQRLGNAVSSTELYLQPARQAYVRAVSP